MHHLLSMDLLLVVLQSFKNCTNNSKILNLFKKKIILKISQIRLILSSRLSSTSPITVLCGVSKIRHKSDTKSRHVIILGQVTSEVTWIDYVDVYWMTPEES